MRIAGVVLGASMVLLVSGPAVASAAEPGRWVDPDVDGPVYVRVEADATGNVGTLPTPSFGGQVAVAAGRPWLHARVGVGASSGPAFAIGPHGRVAAILEAADLRACAAGHRTRHRFRMCGGAQTGVMHLRWSGFDVPGRRELPFVGGVLGGDYGIALGRYIDLHAGIDLSVPIVGAKLSARGPGGVAAVRTGRVATAFRFGVGFRLH